MVFLEGFYYDSPHDRAVRAEEVAMAISGFGVLVMGFWFEARLRRTSPKTKVVVATHKSVS